MKVNLGFAVYIDEVEFKAFLGPKAERYQECFYKWFHENWNDDLQMNSDTVVRWMLFVSPTCNAKVTRRNMKPGEENTRLQYMYF